MLEAKQIFPTELPACVVFCSTECVTEDDQSPDLPWSGLVLAVNNTDDENEDQLFKVV